MAEPEEFVGLGGVRIDNDGPDIRRHKARGATIVSQQGRGGVTVPRLRFVGFDASAGGLVITQAQNASHPAPAVKEVPIEELSGKALFAGLPEVPIARPVAAIPDPTPTPTPVPSVVSINLPAGTTPPSGSLTPLVTSVTPTNCITFVGEFQDYNFPCYEVSVDKDGGFLSIVSPLDAQIKLKPGQNFTIRYQGEEKLYWFSGISLPMPGFGLIFRVFVEARAEPPAQQ